MRHPVSTSSPWGQLTWLFMFLLVMACISLVLSGVLVRFSGIPAERFTALTDPQPVAWLRLVQAVQAFCIFICPPLLLRAIGIRPADIRDGRPLPGAWLLVLLLMICMIPVTNLLVFWNEQMHFPDAFFTVEHWMREKEDAARALTDAFLQTGGSGAFFCNILIVGLLAAIGEEMLFRGTLQPILSRLFRSPAGGIVITGFIFSAIHFQFYGFFPRWLLGMLFGWLFYRTGKLPVAVWAHFLNNFIAILAAWQIHAGRWPEQVEYFGSRKEDLWFTAAAALVVCGLLFLTVRKRKPESI